MPPKRVGAFNLADEDWVIVGARAFFFEPWGSQFEPATEGQVVVRFGGTPTRLRGVDVTVLEGGWVSLWLPEGARTYWLPNEGRLPDVPWETMLLPLDHERGVLSTL